MPDLDDLISNAAFFDEASHTVRQPLLALSMTVAALQIQLADSAAAATVTRLRHSAELLTALIEDVLLIAKLRFAGAIDGRDSVLCQWPELIGELARQRAATGLAVRLLFQDDPSEVPKPFIAARPQLLQLLGRAVDLLILADQQSRQLARVCQTPSNESRVDQHEHVERCGIEQCQMERGQIERGQIEPSQIEHNRQVMGEMAGAESLPPVVARHNGAALSLQIDAHWSDCFRVSEQQAAVFLEVAQNPSQSPDEAYMTDRELQSRLRIAQHLAFTLGLTLRIQQYSDQPPSLLLVQTIA